MKSEPQAQARGYLRLHAPAAGGRLVFLLCWILQIPAALADDLRTTISAGNADYDAGRYDAALEKYAAASQPADPEIGRAHV